MIVPHGWNTGVGLAADLHLVAAAGNARWVEFLTPEPYMDDVFETPLQLDADGLSDDSRWARLWIQMERGWNSPHCREGSALPNLEICLEEFRHECTVCRSPPG